MISHTFRMIEYWLSATSATESLHKLGDSASSTYLSRSLRIGKAGNPQLVEGQKCQKTFDRIRKVMHLYKGERGHRTRGVASRKLWHALHEIDQYLRSQSARLVNYAARCRAGMRVGTAVTEGTANFLVNRRMNKSQQMRWSRRGADLVLQVRCTVYNGTPGFGFGQRFEPIGRPDAAVAIAT
jgi:hypothetical protein